MLASSDDPTTDLYYQIFENLGTGVCDADKKCDCIIEGPTVCSYLSYSLYYAKAVFRIMKTCAGSSSTGAVVMLS
jgi:hypothetical protein